MFTKWKWRSISGFECYRKNQFRSDRKRMNLVLVIDRSGSMGSENKLEQVKNSAVEL